jgi:hypothetical protein
MLQNYWAEIPKDTIKQILVSLDMKVNSFSEHG